jgi:hypothetical protein
VVRHSFPSMRHGGPADSQRRLRLGCRAIREAGSSVIVRSRVCRADC